MVVCGEGADRTSGISVAAAVKARHLLFLYYHHLLVLNPHLTGHRHLEHVFTIDSPTALNFCAPRPDQGTVPGSDHHPHSLSLLIRQRMCLKIFNPLN